MKKLLLLAGIASIAAAPALSAEKVSWIGYTDHPNSMTPEFTFLEQIAADVSKATGGDFTIRMMVGGSLPVKGADVCPAIADGVVQMGVCGSAAAGFLPIYNVARMPMLYETKDELWRGLNEVVTPYLDRALDKKDVKLLAMYSYPYHSVWTINKPIKKLSELKGMKIRTMTPAQALLMKAYGAVTVTLSTGDVATAIQQGVIDGYLTATGGAGKLWIDSVKYNYRTRLSWGPGMVGANKAAFAKLPPAYQKALIDASIKASLWLTDTMYDEEETLTAQFVKEKGLITTPYDAADAAEARKIAEGIWGEQAAKIGPDAVSALKEVRALLGK